MTRYLLDTHALLWWLFDDPRLSESARSVISNRENGILVSAASAWEVSTKYRLGKLQAAEVFVRDIHGYVSKAGFESLAITIQHAQHAGAWSTPHRDPFDRLLAAQVALESLTLITRDPAFGEFQVSQLW